jgi:hypothetical protein
MKKHEVDKLREWFLGNDSAVMMVVIIGALSQEVDDIEDGDGGSLGSVMARAIFDLSTNPFYARFRTTFEPLLLSSLLMWEASNSWAKSKHKETRMYAFVWREITEQVIPVAAYLLGGHEHAVAVARDMHEHYHVDDETYEQWESEQ